LLSSITMTFSRLARSAPTVSTVSFAVLACFSSTPALAQAASSVAQQTVTIAAHLPLSAKDVAADVVVIDESRIRNALASNLADLLQAEAGVQLSRNGGPGQAAGLLIRGANSGNTLVLVDGVRVGSATLGYADLAALGLAQIERIEVLRGPASSLYGADAVGGVVLISTRRGITGQQWSAQAAVGGYGSSEASATVAGAQGTWDWSGSVSREASAGVSALRAGDRFGNYNPDLDGYSRSTLQAQGGWTPMAGHRLGLSLLGTRLRNQFDASQWVAPNYTQDASPDFRSSLNTQVVALGYEGRVDKAWLLKTQLTYSQDDLTAGAAELDRYTTRREQAMAQLAWTPAAGQQWVLALDRLSEKAAATSLLAPVHRDTTGVALGYMGKFQLAGKPLTLQADVRQDDNSVYGTQHTGRAGAVWQADSQWRLRALAGNTFHAPSFNDLYYPGYGVASIRPERGHSAELGMQWQREQQSLSATVWRNRVTDLVAYEPDRKLCPADTAYSYGCARNIGRADLSGLTLEGQAALGPWHWRMGYHYLEAHDGLTQAWLPRRARNQLSAQAQWHQGNWTLAANTQYSGERQDGGVVLRGRQTLDLSARWQWTPTWQLQGKLLNVTNTDWEPARDYQTPRRQAWLGLRVDGQAL
jgi:vitamin B12 transporter